MRLVGGGMTLCDCCTRHTKKALNACLLWASLWHKMGIALCLLSGGSTVCVCKIRKPPTDHHHHIIERRHCHTPKKLGNTVAIVHPQLWCGGTMVTPKCRYLSSMSWYWSSCFWSIMICYILLWCKRSCVGRLWLKCQCTSKNHPKVDEFSRQGLFH